MNTPHQDGLPALPQPTLRFAVGVNQFGLRLDYTAEDMRAYALAALRSAAPSAQPTNTQDAAAGNVNAIRHIAYAEGYVDGKASQAAQPVQQAGELTAHEIEALAAEWGHKQSAFCAATGNPVYRWEFHPERLRAFAHAILSAARADAQPVVPVLTVWFGSMPESNGRENWTVMLRRKLDSVTTDNMPDRHRLLGGMTLFRSEYKDRMRYHADELRFLLGEIDKRPDILDYDADLRSAYVEPTPQPVEKQVPLTDAEIEAIAKPFIRSLGGDYWSSSDDGIKDDGDIEGFARAIERAHHITPPADEGEKL